ncbi:MAG TPA: hypothetical protein PLQ93_08165 [Bacteroidia bacterium]|nr:hypothetical protein [Bacteroidia bacterium]
MKTILLIACTCLISLVSPIQAQELNSYEVKFLKAYFSDPQHKNQDVDVCFLITVKDSSNFPPKLSLPPKAYYFSKGQFVDIPFPAYGDRVSLALYGDNLIIKNPALYDLLKDQVDFQTKDKILILQYKLREFTKDQFSRMKFMFKLYEKKKPEEGRLYNFEFDVKH